jgi:uncharacterized damage-inducible protein DinB
MSFIQPVLQQFTLNTKLFNNVLQDIPDDAGSEQMNEHVNHLQWIAGHLVNARYAPFFGLNLSFPYYELYTDLTQPPPHNRKIDPSLVYPSLSELKKYWNEISPPFLEALSKLNEEQLATDIPFGVPTGKNFLALLNFIASHESYHIGQMSIIRKYLGKSAMSYK